MSEALGDFGFNVLKRLSTSSPGTQIFISPSSLEMALALTAGGAKGATQDCIFESMGLQGASYSEAAAYFRNLSGRLSGADERCSLELANSIWIHNALKVQDNFIATAGRDFDAAASVRDFNAPATLNEINRWCNDRTHGKIPTILEQLDDRLAMAIMNATYFNGEWSFEWVTQTVQPFKAYDGTLKDVEMMYVCDRFRHSEDELFSMLELPYGNGSFVLDILLPKDASLFDRAVQSLSAERFGALSDSLSSKKVAVSVPKFKIEYDTELNDVLSALGMGRAFSGAADFSGISDMPLAIGTVRQKTFVDVNEKGTEAAAVTVIGLKNMAMRPTAPPLEFIADRPFVLVIRERTSGAILFVGQKTGNQ